MPEAAQPVPVMVRRYDCPFCRHRRAAKKAAGEHMARCWRNPATRSCKTCAHLTEVADGEPCVPGQPCHCNEGYSYCEAGMTFGAVTFPVTGCPLWKPRAAAASRMRAMISGPEDEDNQT